MEHSQAERIKISYQEINFKKRKLYFGPMWY